MGKIVLDYVDNPQPKKNDVIVYDTKLGKWKAMSKELFLEEVTTKQKELEDKIAKLNKKILIVDEKITQLGKIMKEGI